MKRYEKLIQLINDSENVVEFTIAIEEVLREVQTASGKRGKLINLEDITDSRFSDYDICEFFKEEVDN